MDRNPKDSRQRYTKESLYASFLELLDEKAVSDITVIEICERAGVSRKTFYKYYSDQFALLMGMQNDMFEDYRDLISAEEPDIFRIAPTLINWAGRNRVLVKAIFANRGEGNFIDRMRLQMVVDFIDCDLPDFIMTRFPTFNVADSFVTVGVAIVILSPFVLKKIHRQINNGNIVRCYPCTR